MNEYDWEEDFSHENGNYECHCCICGRTFIGHKRRVTCRACDNKSQWGDPIPPVYNQKNEDECLDCGKLRKDINYRPWLDTSEGFVCKECLSVRIKNERDKASAK